MFKAVKRNLLHELIGEQTIRPLLLLQNCYGIYRKTYLIG
jgi:hypothetical protein